MTRVALVYHPDSGHTKLMAEAAHTEDRATGVVLGARVARRLA